MQTRRRVPAWSSPDSCTTTAAVSWVWVCSRASPGSAETQTGPGGLWGAIEDDHVRAPLGGWPRHRAGCEARLVASCGGAVLDAAAAAGRHLSLDDAVALALEQP